MIWLLACHKEVVTPCEWCDGACEVAEQKEMGHDHVDGEVDYADPPPTSGDHDACWATWGAHAEAVPDENWVHNLEHGGVACLFNCPELCYDEAANVQAWAEGELEPGRWVLTPYSEMDPGWAAVAWEWRMTLACSDLDAFQWFYDEHVGHGREDETADPPDSCGG